MVRGGASLEGAHVGEELAIAFGFAQLVNQQFYCFHRREWVEDLAKDPDALQVFFEDGQFIFRVPER